MVNHIMVLLNTLSETYIFSLPKGTNAVFDFSLVGGDGKFSVVSDGNLGYITVNGSLDFETNKNFTFLVRF